MDNPRARLQDPAAVRKFIEAGNATLTLVSGRTGTRFTYKFASIIGGTLYPRVSLTRRSTLPENPVLKYTNHHRHPAVSIDFGFGFTDGKGRPMGTTYSVHEFDVADDGTGTGNTKSGHYFEVYVNATRAGKSFGSGCNRSNWLKSLDEAEAYIAKYLKGARRTADKRSRIENARKVAA